MSAQVGPTKIWKLLKRLIPMVLFFLIFKEGDGAARAQTHFFVDKGGGIKNYILKEELST